MNASKQKGTAGETAVVRYLRERGWPHAERRALRGTKDAGDVSGLPGVVIEVKAQKAMALAAWLDEAELERDNAKAELGVVWHRRVGKAGPNSWYVTMSGEAFTDLLRAARW